MDNQGEGENGSLLCDPVQLKDGRIFYIWNPNDEYNLASCAQPEYTTFDSLSHVDHFEDYVKNQRNGSFFPNKLNYYSNSHFHYKYRDEKIPEIVWFGPKTCSKKHSFYGNVYFNIPMDKFMKLMKNLSLNLYFVEITDFKCTSSSRFLFTHKEYENLTPYDPKKKGGAWYENEGQHFLLTSLKRWKNPSENMSYQDHEFEIMLEINDDDYRQLFKICETEAVDHSDFSQPGKRCKKNIATRKECPSPWSKDKTENQMKINKKRKLSNDSESETNDSDSDAESNADLHLKKIKISKENEKENDPFFTKNG